MSEPPPKNPKQRRAKDPGVSLALAGAGLELGLVTAVLCLGGWWLDGVWGVTPWLMITGAFVGIVGGIYNLWKQGQRAFKQHDRLK